MHVCKAKKAGASVSEKCFVHSQYSALQMNVFIRPYAGITGIHSDEWKFLMGLCVNSPPEMGKLSASGDFILSDRFQGFTIEFSPIFHVFFPQG